MSLIDDILRASKTKLDARKASVPMARLRERAIGAPRSRTTFRSALQSQTFSVIAEVKRRSPTAGPMDDQNVKNALKVYESSPSVSAISILTDEDYFSGSIEHLSEARKQTTKPILRKDFIVDEYQIWEARAYGADAVLLMAGLHVEDPSRAKRLFDLATKLGMDALFELGMSGDSSIERQRETVPRDAMIWGVNSRRFQSSHVRAKVGSLVRNDLSIDSGSHKELRNQIPRSKLAVAESGIQAPSEVRSLADCSYRAVLIGTAFLKKGAVVGDVVAGFDAEIKRMRVPGAASAPANSPGILSPA
jgi:indole-3-glycerol phosphate synthase